MEIVFIPCGRLGNALFRYLICALFCIIYNANYNTDKDIYKYRNIRITDDYIDIWINNVLNDKIPKLENKPYYFIDYYQHDKIYYKYRNELFNYMKSHPEHYVLTDGIISCDGNFQKFYISQILNNPIDFTKYYHNVIHLRLNDFVSIGWYIKVEKFFPVLDSLDFTKKTCIVCQKPETEFEIEYINTLINKYHCEVEHNDTLTDFHIMRNANVLVCSNSTLSWMAVYFSETIHTCFMPDHKYDFKKPIDNTIIYKI